MIQGLDPVLQGLLGTLFTWAVTAAGAACVFIVPSNLSFATEGKVLDASLGFASGVMLAASYWSLLAPAIEMAEAANYGDYAFLPAAVGFFFGAAFVWITDVLLPHEADNPAEALKGGLKDATDATAARGPRSERAPSVTMEETRDPDNPNINRRRMDLRSRKSASSDAIEEQKNDDEYLAAVAREKQSRADAQKSWRRILLLVIAVTIHNFPEGLAVGVGFGGIGKGNASFETARMIAIGIGIQNFPEGLAVALPMRRLGYSKFQCFWYGQLSGMVEPIGGVLGAYAVLLAEPILPYALAFAAGAMVYVVVDSLVPEVQTRGNSSLASWGTVVGFIVMMALDVALG